MPAVCCNVTVLQHEAIRPEVRLLTVQWADQEHIPHAGQFFMLRSWGADEAPTLSRPISVHGYEAATGELQFLYEVRGLGTQKLAAALPGQTVQVTGPAGNGFIPAEYTGRIAVVGGGIGTAPLLQLVKELDAAGKRPEFFCGFRSGSYGLDEFAPYCEGVHLATDDGSEGFHGFVTQILEPKDFDLVLCCGPTPMMRAVAKLCKEAGTRCLVSLENKMACGIGACLGCTCHAHTGAKCVCKEGPVFDAEEVF